MEVVVFTFPVYIFHKMKTAKKKSSNACVKKMFCVPTIARQFCFTRNQIQSPKKAGSAAILL